MTDEATEAVKVTPADDVWFKIKIGDEEYVLPKYTLGDAMEVKDLFGVRLDDIDVMDPNCMAGMLYLCKCKQRPTESKAAILEEVRSINVGDFIVVAAEPETEDDAEDEAAPLEPTPQPSEQSTPETSDDAPAVVPGDSESGTTPEAPGPLA
jgi:hypothetical protein